VTAYLTKPVKQSFLLESIQIVLGLRSWDKGQMVPFVTRHTLKKTKKTARILLAEDNVINQKLVVKILEKTGYDISVASNGEQAVSLLEKEKLDLVLMDIQMPKMDGFDATIHIREKEKKTGGHIPIIALTAHAMKGDRERCMEAGMDGYVSKPIKSEELLNTIHRVLHKQ
jgi:CheY-like chemotaxis protein